MSRQRGTGATADSTPSQSPDVASPLPASYEPNHILQMLVQNQKDIASLTTKIDRLIDDVKDQTARMTSSEICMARIETNIEHAKDEIRETRADLKKHKETAQLDFRILFGAIITATLGLGAVMAHGFKWF
jgi:hypothetical protein